MSDAPTISGYEWWIKCDCGGEIYAGGLGNTGPDGDWKHGMNAEVESVTDGTTFQCKWCGEEWEVNITKHE